MHFYFIYIIKSLYVCTFIIKTKKVAVSRKLKNYSKDTSPSHNVVFLFVHIN